MTAGTGPGKTLRVVVADDHPLFRDGLVAALAMIDGVEVVGTAADGEQAITLTRELAPNVVLMDLAMPGVNGIEATRAIAQTHPAGFQNPAMGSDLGFYATHSYSLTRLPRTG